MDEARAGAARRLAAQALARLRGVSRAHWLIVGLLALVAVGSFAVGRWTSPASAGEQTPPNVAVPAHATLVRWDHFLAEGVQSWYYDVPDTSHEALVAFYRAELARAGWTCFRTETSTAITRDGKAYSGSSVYITALRGKIKARLYTADQDYGSFLLQYDLPERSIGLKVSLEAPEKLVCV